MKIMTRLITVCLGIAVLLSACGQQSAYPGADPIQTESYIASDSVEATLPEMDAVTESMLAETEEQETQPSLSTKAPADAAFVAVKDYIPDIVVELKYASADNFTGQVIYAFDECYLRYGTVKKLMEVQKALAEQGLGLKIWDGFRPVAAQHTLWEVYPDPTYVANPEMGYSSHSRGNTVDLTLVDSAGRELVMPTEFDDFSDMADRDYSDCDVEAAENAWMLQSMMEAHGFTGYFGEWWHFSDAVEYSVDTVFDPGLVSSWYAKCEEFISLRVEPDTSAQVITRIPVGHEFTLLGYIGDFSMVEYQGAVGYVLTSYTAPVQQVDALAVPQVWIPNCEEYITLRENTQGDCLGRIPRGESFELLGWSGAYARVDYKGQWGYVLSSHIRPWVGDYLSACLDIVSPTAAYSHSRMLEDMKRLAEKYPQTISLEVIATSEQGREIPVLQIGKPDAECHVLFQGAIHGREHMTAWLLMAMVDYWMEHGCGEYAEGCIHVIPMVNPDGVTVSQTGQLDAYQATLYEEDYLAGYTEEDQKEYAKHWKANGLGVDLNRNFSAGWEMADDRTAPSAMLYRGKAPFCAAESAALRDYTLSWDFDATVSYHASGCVIYWEYGDRQPVNVQSQDLAQHLQAVTGYLPQGSDGVDGAGFKDWAMDDLSIPSVTVEIGCGSAPLAERELYATFARNAGVFEAVVKWVLQKSS